MNEATRQLSPLPVWNYFADLNAIPRPSKKEERIIAFIKSFGENLKLETRVDAVGNVIIRKPASKGMEDRQTVVLQSHLDMVHQKNGDTDFDFDKQGIEMNISGDWVMAKGTTLGADNGIGVASIMAILASKDIAHPPIEALLTIDEETGMTGALALKGGLLKGDILLNLDTEEDNELTIGCAGGIDVTAKGFYKQEATGTDTPFRLSIKGLTGGHSGVDIHKGRANANKLMNRVLLELTDGFKVRIASIDGGSLRNAIPRESVADILVEEKAIDRVKEKIALLNNVLKNEYGFTDPNCILSIETVAKPVMVLNSDFQFKLLRALYSCPNGIYRMTPEIPGLVQSSNNIARVLLKDGNFSIQCLTRSAVDSEKMDLARSISAAFELMDANIEFGGNYPGWAPKPGALIVKLMSGLYQEMFGEPAHVNAVHAGLECGIIGKNYPEMQMISFGPTIHGAHSPDEKVKISSVQKYWGYLLETLKRIPAKA